MFQRIEIITHIWSEVFESISDIGSSMITIQTEFTGMTTAQLNGLQLNYPSRKNRRSTGFKKSFWLLSDISFLKEPAPIFLVVLY